MLIALFSFAIGMRISIQLSIHKHDRWVVYTCDVFCIPYILVDLPVYTLPVYTFRYPNLKWIVYDIKVWHKLIKPPPRKIKLPSFRNPSPNPDKWRRHLFASCNLSQVVPQDYWRRQKPKLRFALYAGIFIVLITKTTSERSDKRICYRAVMSLPLRRAASILLAWSGY